MKFKWTKIEQYTFDEIKRILVRKSLLTYADFNEEFRIHTNASAFQLWAFISQIGKPMDFYSRKLTKPPKMYAVIEIELLSTIETLK